MSCSKAKCCVNHNFFTFTESLDPQVPPTSTTGPISSIDSDTSDTPPGKYVCLLL